jgi:hypothetical protein
MLVAIRGAVAPEQGSGRAQDDSRFRPGLVHWKAALPPDAHTRIDDFLIGGNEDMVPQGASCCLLQNFRHDPRRPQLGRGFARDLHEPAPTPEYPQ